MKNKAQINPSEMNLAVLDGALVRQPDGWIWKDGTKETKVFDSLLGELFDFGCSVNCVQVPIFEVDSQEVLSWVKNGDYKASYCSDPVKVRKFLNRFPDRRQDEIKCYLVPLEEWQQRMNVISGFCFSETDRPYLAEKAKSFGSVLEEPPKLKPEVSSFDWPVALEANELKLVAEVLNGIDRRLAVDEYNWSFYTKGTALCAEVCDGMYGDRLDLKYNVHGEALLEKLKCMDPQSRRVLMLRLAEFWHRAGDPMDNDSFFNQLKAEINREEQNIVADDLSTKC